jgi:hypothetical protein
MHKECKVLTMHKECKVLAIHKECKVWPYTKNARFGHAQRIEEEMGKQCQQANVAPLTAEVRWIEQTRITIPSSALALGHESSQT